MAQYELSELIERQKRKILGATDWMVRAKKGDIKRSPEAIEKASDDLSKDRAILATLEWLFKNSDAVKTAAEARKVS